MRSLTPNIALLLLLTASAMDPVDAENSARSEITQIGAAGIDKRATRTTLPRTGAKWTVAGRSQPGIGPNIDGNDWSVGKNSYELLVVIEPTSNIKILPQSNPVPNTSPKDSLSVVASKGEYESASFVIRAGAAALNDVQIHVSDLVSKENGARLKRESVELRLIKNWYQAGDSIRRERGDFSVLTPELLLHDNDLVRIDPIHNANLIRDMKRIEDSERLLPFHVPIRTNQQVLLTTLIPDDALAGNYQGQIVIQFRIGDQQQLDRLSLSITVLPLTLPDPIIEYALFYTSRLAIDASPTVNAAEKTAIQMLKDFILIREYGFTNVAIGHKFRWKRAKQADLEDLDETMILLRRAGFTTRKFLYVDWQVTDSHSDEMYTAKIDQLTALAAKHGFTELYVYHQDERSPRQLFAERRSLITTHARGAKSFVATSAKDIGKLKGLLDIAILNRTRGADALKEVRAAGIIPWAYDNPQAGEEKPGTYRNVYGINLWLAGFDGTCAYAYQTGSHGDPSGWDDWGGDRWRPHILAYPTLTTPIPTLQIVGWREAIDDVRYLTLLLQSNQNNANEDNQENRLRLVEDVIGQKFSGLPSIQRRQIIDALLRTQITH